MTELNLQNIWDSNEAIVAQHYERVQADVLSLAQSQSQTILARIHRNTVIELAASFILLVAMSTYLWDVPKGLLFIFVSYSLITFWIALQFWIAFRQKTNKVHSQDAKTAISQYIELLQSYKTHLWNYSVSLIPFTVFIGFIGGYCKGSNNQLHSILASNVLWISLAVLVVLMGMGYLLLNQFFKMMLDGEIEELKTLLKRLEN